MQVMFSCEIVFLITAVFLVIGLERVHGGRVCVILCFAASTLFFSIYASPMNTLAGHVNHACSKQPEAGCEVEPDWGCLGDGHAMGLIVWDGGKGSNLWT